MRCGVCGSENDDRLIFCQQCGHRLRPREQKPLAPTPAVGLAAGPRPKRSDATARLSSSRAMAGVEPAARLSRPAAPMLVLPLSEAPPPASEEAFDVAAAAQTPGPAQTGGAAREPGTAPVGTKPSLPVADHSRSGVVQSGVAGAAAVERQGTRCEQCGSTSPKGYRFCLGCGAVLEAGGGHDLRSAAAEARRPRGRLGTSQGVSLPAAPAPGPRTRGSRTGTTTPVGEPLPAQRVVSVGEEPVVASAVCPTCGAQASPAVSSCSRCGSSLPRHTDRGLGEDRPPASVGRPPVSLPSPRRRESDERDPTGLPFELVARGRKPPQPSEPAAAKPTGRTDRPNRQKGAVSAPTPTARLVVIVEDGSEGAAMEVSGDQVDIGRTEGDILFAEDRYMSPRHARLLRRDGAWYVRDLGSVNGVYRRIRGPEVLKDRDLLLLGLEVVEFQLVDHAERGLGHAVQHGTLVFGSPAASRPARLCQRTVEGIIRDVHYLVSDETTVGRETGDVVFTSDPFMSRRHACIQWQEAHQRYVLTDQSSSNGTYLAIRGDCRLEDGEFIRLGQHLFRVDLLTPGAQTRSGPR